MRRSSVSFRKRNNDVGYLSVKSTTSFKSNIAYYFRLALELMEKEALTTNDISEILGERPYRTEDYRKYLEMARS